MAVDKAEMKPCSCGGNCTSYILVNPMGCDSRFSKDDARRLIASWNMFLNASLEDLEKLVVAKENNNCVEGFISGRGI